MNHETRLISLNINGLNSPIKRKQILTRLAKQKAEIICLQEVHIKEQFQKCLEYPKLGRLFTALADQKQRGIAVYIKEGIKAVEKYVDPNGRVLILELEICQKPMLLVVIYAPNENQSQFYSNLHDKILEIGQGNICIVGDFNAVTDIRKDYISGIKTKKKRKSLNKERWRKQNRLQEEIKELESRLQKTPQDEKMKTEMILVKHKYYEPGRESKGGQKSKTYFF
uniref:exodeoxyribonuclease III n=1 Tax=Naja naja TaxID=35670 RepID=A0A8C6VBH7_NAJNA